MKKCIVQKSFGWLLPVALVLVPSVALASEGSGRALWDQIWMYINAAILFSLIFKYGRKPLVNFLKGQGEAVAVRIREVEEKRTQVAEELALLKEQLAKRDEYINTIMVRATEEAEALKKSLIEEAENEARILMENAERQAVSKLQRARNRFRAELVGLAVELAESRLKQDMAAEDQKRLQDDYLKFIEKAA
ncbi:MAG: ATP synthase F0 subunit B [Thermodesulfobacteriota bacterium]